MKIKTDVPIINNREKITRKIGQFWDKISEAWQIVWGPHIHHGYYENNSVALTPLQAQEKLIEKLTELLEITPQSKILDVGCGMGGTCIYLANKYQAIVTGITLSQKQVDLATQQAHSIKIQNVEFKIEDALSLASLANNSFDIIWSLESCEQFYDKHLFIQQAHRVLKPGGKLMLATWCSDKDEYINEFAKKYQQLCNAFDSPYMPTIKYYHELLNIKGFDNITTLDWTNYVKKSWDIGISLVNTYTLLQIIKLSGWRGMRFTKQIKLMRDAFNQGSVKYGVFLATKS